MDFDVCRRNEIVLRCVRRKGPAYRFRTFDFAKRAVVFRNPHRSHIYFQCFRYKREVDFLPRRKYVAYTFVPANLFLLCRNGEKQGVYRFADCTSRRNFGVRFVRDSGKIVRETEKFRRPKEKIRRVMRFCDNQKFAFNTKIATVFSKFFGFCVELFCVSVL